MRALVKVGSKQYFVKEGDVIKTQLPKGSSGNLEIRDVLLIQKNGEIYIGKPYVDGAYVVASILEQKKGKKLRILKYRPKTRYRKRIGFRPIITSLKIEKISI
jgi:large subunit ribosomal protein L21